MLKFKSYLTEGAPTTAQQATWFRAYVKEKVLELNLKITQSSRPKGYAHIKFPTIMPAGKTLFAGWGIKVNDYKGHQKISSRYTPFILVANENIEVGTVDKPKTIPKGTELNWVNSEISQAKSSTPGSILLFANKVLTPDQLGTAGREWDLAGLTTATETAVKNAWPGPDNRTLSKTAEKLIDLLHKANTKSDTISLSGIEFDAKDFPKISADYGETLAAIWVMKSMNFAKVDFPSAVNNKLIDFYGIKFGAKYPFSVKSGTTGGKVTVMNIIRAIKSRAKTRDYKADGELAYQVFKIVEEMTMKEQMIALHQKFDTPTIKALAKLMGHGPSGANEITVERIDAWTKEQNTVKKDVWNGKGRRPKGKKGELKGDQSYKNHLLVAKMKSWHAMKGGSQPKAATLLGNDLVRFVITSLGQSIYPLLNTMPGMAESLTNVARQVAMIQINVNVKTNSLTFKSNFFKKADFKFAWAGYSGGNALGFTMKMS